MFVRFLSLLLLGVDFVEDLMYTFGWVMMDGAVFAFGMDVGTRAWLTHSAFV